MRRANATLSIVAALADQVPPAVDLSPPADLMPAPPPDMMAGKPRLFVITDMGNEPDDQMSMVRLMVYANEIDIEGLAAAASFMSSSQ